MAAKPLRIVNPALELASRAEYAAFLQNRKVEYVIIYTTYDHRYQTNEHALLRDLAVARTASESPCASLTVSTAEYDVFAVRPEACTP